MKKQQLKNLSLQKNIISSFSTEAVKAGAGNTSNFFPPDAYGCPFACKVPPGN